MEYIGPEFQRYLSQLPVSAFPYLNMPLDLDNDYDRDLVEIAKQLLRWEELLVCPFKLSRADIHGIKTTNQDSSELQRYIPREYCVYAWREGICMQLSIKWCIYTYSLFIATLHELTILSVQILVFF